MSEVNFLVSKRGKRILEYKNYMYYFHRNNQNRSFWYCIKSVKKRCTCRINLIGTQVQQLSGFHNHEPEKELITTSKFRTELKNMVKEKATDPIPQLYKENLSKYAGRVEAVPFLPSYNKLRTCLYTARGSLLPQDNSKDDDVMKVQEAHPPKVQDVKPTRKKCQTQNRKMKQLQKLKLEEQKKMDAELSGRRIVDISFFIQQIREMSVHGNNSCSFKDMILDCEVQRGFNSAFKFRCQVCSLTKFLWTNVHPESNQQRSVNADAVAGITEIGGGYSGLRKFSTALSIPCLSRNCYANENSRKKREAVLLTVNKDLDKDPEENPVSVSVVDGTWAMIPQGENL